MNLPKQSYSVRLGTHADIAELVPLWEELMQYHEKKDKANFLLAPQAAFHWEKWAWDIISQNTGFLVVAEKNSVKKIGFCIGWIAKNPPIYAVSDIGFISEVAVTQSFRKQGVGTALLHRAEQWFKEKGVGEYQLSSAIWNESAKNLWASLGANAILVRYRFEVK